MKTFLRKKKMAALLCGLTFLQIAGVTIAGETRDGTTNSGAVNRIEIKDFSFNPQTITVKSGDKITWINKDEEPHTVVSGEKQFKKSSALDTNDEFSVTAGAPGTYTYFCSVHPKMTGTIIVQK